MVTPEILIISNRRYGKFLVSNGIGRLALAFRTAKPFWPTNLEQMIVTCLFGIELLLKPLKCHRFLFSHVNHSRTFFCIYYIKQMFVFKALLKQLDIQI
jgi:hypothetical protein